MTSVTLHYYLASQGSSTSLLWCVPDYEVHYITSLQGSKGFQSPSSPSLLIKPKTGSFRETASSRFPNHFFADSKDFTKGPKSHLSNQHDSKGCCRTKYHPTSDVLSATSYEASLIPSTFIDAGFISYIISRSIFYESVVDNATSFFTCCSSILRGYRDIAKSLNMESQVILHIVHTTRWKA